MPNQDRTSLFLIIPGLLPVVDQYEREALNALSCPSLEKLLGKAECSTGARQGIEATLADVFAVSSANQPVSMAAVSACADLESVQVKEAHWLRVDPVYLHADKDGVALHGSEQLELMQEEANSLVRELNDLYREDGWVFHAPHPQRWYLQMQEEPGATFTSLFDVLGKNIRPFLPAGKKGNAWNAFLSEVQMLLHSSSVNQQRNMEGKLIVNSIWPWGAGSIPDIRNSLWSAIWADESLVKGFAHLASVACGDLPESANTLMEKLEYEGKGKNESRYLVYLDQPYRAMNINGSEEWQRVMNFLEEKWFAPVLEALKENRLEEVKIIPCNGLEFLVNRKQLRKFWKRTKPLLSYCPKERDQ